MQSKLAMTALVVASFLVPTTIASAQSDPAQSAPGASGEANVGAKSHVTHHRMRSTHARTGVTTGMAHRSSTARSKPGGQAISPKTPASY